MPPTHNIDVEALAPPVENFPLVLDFRKVGLAWQSSFVSFYVRIVV